jgi:hypothetical protein
MCRIFVDAKWRHSVRFIYVWVWQVKVKNIDLFFLLVTTPADHSTPKALTSFRPPRTITSTGALHIFNIILETGTWSFGLRITTYNRLNTGLECTNQVKKLHAYRFSNTKIGRIFLYQHSAEYLRLYIKCLPRQYTAWNNGHSKIHDQNGS